MRLLGLLTALYQSPPRSLLAIEEPELTVHPGALGVLRDALLEISERSQLLVTTHSPDLLYDLPAETLRVVEKVDNITVVGKVAEEQRQAIAKKLFFPGELMRMEELEADMKVYKTRPLQSPVLDCYCKELKRQSTLNWKCLNGEL